MPKCAKCKKDLNKAEAYVVETTSEKTGKVTRKYYCSEDEYKRIIKDREDRDAVYKEILKYFPMIKTSGDLPRNLFITIGGIAEEKGWAELLEYLNTDVDYLDKWMDKEFKNCNAKANYLGKVILNRIGEEKAQIRVPIIKQIEEDFTMPEPMVQPKKKIPQRKGFDDLLEEL